VSSDVPVPFYAVGLPNVSQTHEAMLSSFLLNGILVALVLYFNLSLHFQIRCAQITASLARQRPNAPPATLCTKERPFQLSKC
jgi:hypothetical protein